MRCDLCSLLVFGLSQWLAFSARPTNFAALTSDLVGELEARSHRACPQEEPLREVLLGLGLEEEKLQDLHDVGGVGWNGCDVVKLDFSYHIELKGSLSKAFLELPSLKHLILTGTSVSGDLALLAKSPELRKLELLDLEVTGDLKELEKATKMQILDLGGTKIFGNLKALAKTVELEYLDLSQTRVTGDLGALQNAEKLYGLYLSDTKVEGDIKALQKVTKLEDLELENTNVFGDMASLREAKLLLDAKVAGTRITTGTNCPQEEEVLRQVLLDLGLKDEELSDLHDVDGVDWNGCDVSGIHINKQGLQGSLSTAFHELPKLQKLDLSKTKVSGDLAMLAKCNELIMLDLDNTNITGDLKALENAKGLKGLYLSDTRVTGDLETFKNAQKLHFLHLSLTKVTGDLKALENARELTQLYLSQTQVTGNLDSAIFFYHDQRLTNVDLSHTKVNGSLTALEGAFRLRTLDLSHTKVAGDVVSLQNVLTSANKLKYLDISGISIGGDIRHLRSAALETLKAAGCRLQGSLTRKDEHGYKLHFPALVTLDLADNEIARVEEIPERCRTLILSGSAMIDFAPGVLRRAVENDVYVDLTNATLGNEVDVQYLLNSGTVRSGGRTDYKERGFACHDVVGASLQVSPEKFSPEGLCTCMPGWRGKGTDCTSCPNDTFKETYSDVNDTCIPCPPGSKAPQSSTQLKVCLCNIGKLYEKNGVPKCGCRAHEAFLNDKDGCVSCNKLQLDCSNQGSQVQSAKPLPGFFRFDNMSRAYRCLEPKERCTPDGYDFKTSPDPVCHSNYTGTMCMECADKFYAHGRRCEKCPHAQIPDASLLPLVAGFAVACGLASFCLWRWISTEAHGIPSRRSALMKQLMAQGPLLLQMCQLWAVLAALASHTAADPEGPRSGGKKATFWEIPYVQFLQLSMTNLKGALTLQCRFDGRAVRFVSAMAAPLLPLLVLLCCMAVELMKPGLGITAALQALTLLFVGGASSTSALLSCRRKDGFRDPLPQGSEFRILMPYIPCGNSTSTSASTLTLKTQVDSVGYSAALVYIAVIPLCLLYLLLRLRTVLQASVTTTWAATAVKDGLKVRVSDLVPVSTDSIEKKPLDREDVRRLIAAAVACIAVLYRGRVEVQVTDQAAIVRLLEDTSTRASRDLLEGDLMDIFEGENARAEKLKCRVIAKMLTERAILQGVLSDDRLLSGAKSLLMKYALGRHIWLEIVQKLVAVALVAIVSKIEGMMMPVAVTLVMAATSVAVRPYAQLQVNTLHSFSFFCLAVSAVSFAWGEPWPGRIALAAPFVLSALQALRPDSAEALAIRLWEDLERQIDALEREEVVEVTVETYRFL